MNMSKDVVIGDHKYRVGRFKAQVGSWILIQLLTKMLPSLVSGQMGDSLSGLPTGGPSMSEADFTAIQNHCLAACFRYEGDVAMPVVAGAGVFAIREMEYDLGAVIALTVHALEFNFSSFFAEDGLKALASLSALSAFSPSNSTP